MGVSYASMKMNVKKRLMHRLKIVEGQVRGLQKMAEQEEYCIDIITQTQATKEALSSIEDFMLENHLKTHVIEQMKSNKDRPKAINEILSVYKVSKRK
jgi:CsoR family transcriptional regulator, copper-sensing transcriptional repressor